MKNIFYTTLLLLVGGVIAFFGFTSSSDELQQTNPVNRRLRHTNPVAKVVPEIEKTKVNMIEPESVETVASPALVGSIIKGAGTDADFKLIHELKSAELGSSDHATLHAFLMEIPENDEVDLALYSLKNELMHELLNKNNHLEELAAAFSEILNNPNQSTVMKDYVLQFTPKLINKLEVSNTLRELLINDMFEMTNYKEDTVAGTALVQLMRLQIDPERIFERASKILESDEYTNASKAAAIRVLKFSEKEDNIYAIKKAALDPLNSMQVRTASIHSYASTNPKDNNFSRSLDEIINNPKSDKRLIWAANAAKKSIFMAEGNK